MPAVIGVDEVKDAIVTVLKTDMAAAILAVNTDRGDGVTIVAPSVNAYFTDEREKGGHIGTPYVQITTSAEDKTLEVGDRQIWETDFLVRMHYVGRGEVIDTVKKKLDRYRDILNRILGAYSNNTLGGNVWCCEVIENRVNTDSRFSGNAEVTLKVWTNN